MLFHINVPLAWLAAKKNIPVIILYGEYGVPRLWRLSKSNDIFYGIGHPNKESINGLDKKKKFNSLHWRKISFKKNDRSY